MAETLVKIVIELLSVLSIATKEVKRPLASELSERDLSHTSRFSFVFRVVREETTGEDGYRGRSQETRSLDTGRSSDGDSSDSEVHH